ncbi:hypothetical protein GTZ93_15360 [Corallococcus exiguus]|uniref:Uncharacterized protein n=4 Tax=Corallococcus TaxID=83461 RepID=A0A7X5BUG9_9BACT|nr:hypothetical protein [Corallococcus exiguus]NBC41207.1 hypothetical protein [Corallococcus exiguus]
MFTVFDLFRLLSVLAGAGVGAFVGHGLLGWMGAAGGVLVGWVVGYGVGGLPFFFVARFLNNDLRRADPASLSQRLEAEYFISHLILAELAQRGEDLAKYEEPILQLLRSESGDRRRHGWASLRFFYPARAEALADYKYEAPAEECRKQVEEALAKGRPVEQA